MLEKLLVEYSAPTLAGLKPASMFVWNYENLECDNCKKIVQQFNEKLNSRGIFINILKENSNKCLVFVYREKLLKTMLEDERAMNILYNRGYDVQKDIRGLLAELSLRIRCFKCFPHEIGVFLGYPIEDVVAFIENKGKNCRAIGCWKVYQNECYALKLFEKYLKCKSLYTRYFQKGWSVESLTVAA